MKKERDPYWECVKGIAILAIVVGHGYALLHDFVYAWHLPVFFFVSGWFYNEKKYGDYPELNFAVRIKNNLPKYFTYSCILIMLHLVLQNILGVETLKERFSLGSAVIYSLESVVFKANDYLAGSIVYCIIKFPKVAEAIPQSCRGNFPNNAAVFGASLSLLGW